MIGKSCNIFLRSEQYTRIKDLGHKLEKPYSELVRNGVDLVLKKYDSEGGKNENKRK